MSNTLLTSELYTCNSFKGTIHELTDKIELDLTTWNFKFFFKYLKTFKIFEMKKVISCVLFFVCLSFSIFVMALSVYFSTYIKESRQYFFINQVQIELE